MSPAGQEKLDHDWKRAQATAAVVEGCCDRAEAAAKAAKEAVDAADAAEQRAAEEAAAARAAAVAGDAAKLAAEARAARDVAVDDATPAARAATEAATARAAADALKDLVAGSVDSTHWFGGPPPNFRTLYLNQIDVDSADFWTNRLLLSSSPSTAEELASKRSHTRTLKSG